MKHLGPGVAANPVHESILGHRHGTQNTQTQPGGTNRYGDKHTPPPPPTTTTRRSCLIRPLRKSILQPQDEFLWGVSLDSELRYSIVFCDGYDGSCISYVWIVCFVRYYITSLVLCYVAQLIYSMSFCALCHFSTCTWMSRIKLLMPSDNPPGFKVYLGLS